MIRTAQTRWLLIGVVVVAWGSNYPLLKMALRDMPPVTFAALRMLGAALVLGGLNFKRSNTLEIPAKGERCALAMIGLLQLASVLGLAGIGLRYLEPGRTVVLVYTMPIWVVMWQWLLARQKVNRWGVIGVAVASAGMVLFLNGQVLDLENIDNVIGVGFVLSAAICWGAGAVLYKRRKWRSDLRTQTLWQLVWCCGVLAVGALLIENEDPATLTDRLLIILAWNWVVPTVVAVLCWNKVVTEINVVVAGTAIMATPLVGILSSVLLLNEAVPQVFALSAVLVGIGGVLVLTHAGGRSEAARR